MSALSDTECWRAIKPVSLDDVLPLLAGLPFFAVGQSKPGMYQCDVITQSQFPAGLRDLMGGLGLGGETARAVLRRLRPHQSIPPHIDQWMPSQADWRRFQVPLVTDPSIIMRWPDDGQEVHLEAGWLYEVRYDRLHEVINKWDGHRTHMQIDQVGATI